MAVQIKGGPSFLTSVPWFWRTLSSLSKSETASNLAPGSHNQKIYWVSCLLAWEYEPTKFIAEYLRCRKKALFHIIHLAGATVWLSSGLKEAVWLKSQDKSLKASQSIKPQLWYSTDWIAYQIAFFYSSWENIAERLSLLLLQGHKAPRKLVA